MSQSSKLFWKCCALAVCVTALGILPKAYAQSQSEDEAQPTAVKPQGINTHTGFHRQSWLSKQDGGGQLTLSCVVDRPGQVRRFAVTCTGTKQIDVKAADCCLPGDHWQMKVKSWDFKPNTGVATTPGGAGVFSVPARVFTYSSARDMNALIECSYLHGVNVFPAETDIVVETHSGTCSAVELGVTDEIDRSP
jgi:hypothetical protein